MRIGGARVGQVSKIEPKRRPDGTAYAQVTLKLDKEIEPLPADSTVLVRPRSTLGLKYLQVVPGQRPGRLQGRRHDPDPPGAARGRGDRRLLQHVRRQGARGLAELARRHRHRVRGPRPRPEHGDRPAAAAARRPRAGREEPREPAHAARTASSRRSPTRPARWLPVAEEQASLFVNLDTTFTALASIARPFLQESISEGPPSEEVAIREFPRQRPFLRTTPPSSTSCSPAWPRSRTRRRSWPTPSRRAPRSCPRRRRSTASWPTASTRWRPSPRTRMVQRRRGPAHAACPPRSTRR